MKLHPAAYAFPAVLLACGFHFGIEQLSRRSEPWVDLPQLERESREFGDWTYCGLDIPVSVRFNRVGDVEMWMRGRRLQGQRELVLGLLLFAERFRDMEHPLQPSEVWVNIRAARDVPWAAVRRVLDACQDPDVRIYKVHFTVRTR